jgi:hypothetical protein
MCPKRMPAWLAHQANRRGQASIVKAHAATWAKYILARKVGYAHITELQNAVRQLVTEHDCRMKPPRGGREYSRFAIIQERKSNKHG